MDLTTHNMNSPSDIPAYLAIKTDGEKIVDTNFWNSDCAKAGFAYLSVNAGNLRLLVPEAMEVHMAEMRTGHSALVEDSLFFPGACYDIIFVDGTSAPFFVSIDRRSVDTVLRGGAARLHVVTRNGVQLDLSCTIKLH